MSKPWLDYTGQTTAELLAARNKFREDSILAAFEEAIQNKGEDSVSAEERVILIVEALQREVNNGGFEQFFENSSGEYAGELEAALRQIGAARVADLAAKAVQATSPEELQALDQQYFDGMDIDIETGLMRFIEANAERIVVG